MRGKASIYVFSVVCLACAYAHCKNYKSIIELKSTVHTDKSLVLLEDIACLYETDTKIGKIDLWQFSSNQKDVTLSKSSIIMRLKLAGYDINQYKLVGSEKVTIRYKNIVSDAEYLASTGDIIDVIYKTSLIEVKIKAELLLSARKNDVVKLKNLSSNKIIYAKLVDSKTAIIGQ